MGSYNRNGQLVSGIGGPFKCPNCNRTLLLRHKGNKFELKFKCSRCASTIILKCIEKIPITFDNNKFIASSVRNLLMAVGQEVPIEPKVEKALENVITVIETKELE